MVKKKRKYINFKNEAIALRRCGKTYTEIQEMLKVQIPPSTLCTWFGQTSFSIKEQENIIVNGKERILCGRVKAAVTKKLKRAAHFQNIHDHFSYLKKLLNDKDIANMGLVMLYLCEGSKRNGGSLCFGNSDPNIIRLFLRLFRSCYPVDERKFRCTVQCRADQNLEQLSLFWSRITQIPLNQFYGSRVDQRTIGLPTKKADYKGVCRIDYFSAAIYNELRVIGGLL